MLLLKRLLSSNKTRAVILFVIAIIFCASLASYHVGDPSLNLATDNIPQNLMLYLGSYLADLLYQLLGQSSLIIPVCLFFWSYQLFFEGKLRWAFSRLLCMLISILLVACLCHTYAISGLPIKDGGLLGQVLWNNLSQQVPYFAEYRTYIISCIASLAVIFFLLSIGARLKIYVKILSAILGLFVFVLRKLGIPQKFAKYNDNNAYYESAEFGHLNKKTEDSVNKTSMFNNKNKTAPSKNKNKSAVERNVYNQNIMPSVDLLEEASSQSFKPQTQEELKQKSEQLISVLSDFGVKGKIIDVKEGPVVTMYEFEPAAGTKSSRVIGLSDDIARSLSAVSTRIAVIPGRNALGIELPNKQRMFFRLKELVQTQEFQSSSILLPLILGKDLSGAPLVADLAKMPHLLVAGTTGSGKSVAINAMIMSLLYKYTPQECRMIMIDPKMLELSAYDNIPHLMTPVVTEPGKAVVALKWAVKEMEERYRLMSHLGVRNIANYNTKIQEAKAKGQVLERQIQTGFDPDTGKPIHDNVAIEMNNMPFIVVIVDEMADLMLVAGKDIETSIQRLAQMARAAGIHIIMATQRPSVDVITGVIKANFPSRISFKVTSKIDSRTILGEQGAEQLLGMGDMLYMGNSSRILRVHGPFVDDSEVERFTNFLRSTGAPQYISAVTESAEDDGPPLQAEDDNGSSDMYNQAVNIVRIERKSSISYIQRSLRIGYNRAANLVEEMEKNGVLSAPNHSGKREVLLPENE
ncbi:MAG: DNA translocase FtsK [Rickettsiaceae bacterium]